MCDLDELSALDLPQAGVLHGDGDLLRLVHHQDLQEDDVPYRQEPGGIPELDLPRHLAHMEGCRVGCIYVQHPVGRSNVCDYSYYGVSCHGHVASAHGDDAYRVARIGLESHNEGADLAVGCVCVLSGPVLFAVAEHLSGDNDLACPSGVSFFHCITL